MLGARSGLLPRGGRPEAARPAAPGDARRRLEDRRPPPAPDRRRARRHARLRGRLRGPGRRRALLRVGPRRPRRLRRARYGSTARSTLRHDRAHPRAPAGQRLPDAGRRAWRGRGGAQRARRRPGARPPAARRLCDRPQPGHPGGDVLRRTAGLPRCVAVLRRGRLRTAAGSPTRSRPTRPTRPAGARPSGSAWRIRSRATRRSGSTEPGRWTIALDVRDAAGAHDRLERTVEVFSATPGGDRARSRTFVSARASRAPEAVTLDAGSSRDPDGRGIHTYQSDLDGDGSFETRGGSPLHTASKARTAPGRAARLGRLLRDVVYQRRRGPAVPSVGRPGLAGRVGARTPALPFSARLSGRPHVHRPRPRGRRLLDVLGRGRLRARVLGAPRASGASWTPVAQPGQLQPRGADAIALARPARRRLLRIRVTARPDARRPRRTDRRPDPRHRDLPLPGSSATARHRARPPPNSAPASDPARRLSPTDKEMTMFALTLLLARKGPRVSRRSSDLVEPLEAGRPEAAQKDSRSSIPSGRSPSGAAGRPCAPRRGRLRSFAQVLGDGLLGGCPRSARDLAHGTRRSRTSLSIATRRGSASAFSAAWELCVIAAGMMAKRRTLQALTCGNAPNPMC